MYISNPSVLPSNSAYLIKLDSKFQFNQKQSYRFGPSSPKKGASHPKEKI